MGSHVLLVDDEAILAESLSLQLLEAGYPTDYAVSGEECLSRLEAGESYDVVVMDLDLGPEGMSGAQATELIHRGYEVPVLFYTGHTDASTIAQGRGVESYGWLFKADGDFEVLLASIENAVERWNVEHKLSDYNQKLLSLIHGVDLFLCVVDPHTDNVLFANRAVKESFGEVVGRSCREAFGAQANTIHTRARASLHIPEESATTTYDEESVVWDANTERWYALGSTLVDWGLEHRALAVCALNVTGVVTERNNLIERLEQTTLHLEEINHRVKNNLALVNSLVSFAREEMPDAHMLDELYHQVRALSILHERLSTLEKTTKVELRSYVEELVQGMFHPSGPYNVDVEIDVPSVYLSPKSATPLGLIIAELAHNARKHAFSASRTNRFRFTAHLDPKQGHLILEVANDGSSVPPHVALNEPGTKGLRLVTALAQQLRGTVELERDTDSAPGPSPNAGPAPSPERTDGANGTQNGETVFRLRLPRHHLVEEE